MHWASLQSFDTSLKGKLVRFKTTFNGENLNALISKVAVKNVQVPAGSVGLCYSVNGGTILIGFGKNFKNPPSMHSSPTSFAASTKLTIHDIGKLEIDQPVNTVNPANQVNDYQLMKERLAKFQELRSNTEKLYTEIEIRWNGEKRNMDQLRLGLDFASDILTMLVSMGTTGIKSIGATTAQLQNINAKLLQSTYKLAAEVPYQLIKKSTAIQNSEWDYTREKEERDKAIQKTLEKKGIQLSKDVLSSTSLSDIAKKLGSGCLSAISDVLNIFHPSFFAEKLTGVNPEQIHAEVLSRIHKEKNKALSTLDRKIMYLFEELQKFKKVA